MSGARITITTTLVQETDKAFALWDGAMHEITDSATGEVTDRRHFEWVPRSQVTITKRTNGSDDRGRPVVLVEVDLPEWLAREKGLIDGRCANTGDLFS